MSYTYNVITRNPADVLLSNSSYLTQGHLDATKKKLYIPIAQEIITLKCDCKANSTSQHYVLIQESGNTNRVYIRHSSLVDFSRKHPSLGSRWVDDDGKSLIQRERSIKKVFKKLFSSEKTAPRQYDETLHFSLIIGATARTYLIEKITPNLLTYNIDSIEEEIIDYQIEKAGSYLFIRLNYHEMNMIDEFRFTYRNSHDELMVYKFGVDYLGFIYVLNYEEMRRDCKQRHEIVFSNVDSFLAWTADQVSKQL